MIITPHSPLPTPHSPLPLPYSQFSSQPNSTLSKIADNISKSEREAFQTLINRTDIVIKPADKGKGTVILNTDDYKKECYRQLNDSKFYRKLQKDTTHHIEERIKRRLKDMMIDDEIDEEPYNYLLPRRSRPARFYISPKIHKNKDNPPGRICHLSPHRTHISVRRRSFKSISA